MQIVYNEVEEVEAIAGEWSIYAEGKNGQDVKIADFDTFLSLNGKHESQVVQNAIEQGQFRSVNKIRKPDVFVVELAKGGSPQDIQLVLDNLIKYKEGTDLMTLTTPFGVWDKLNLTNIDYLFKQGENAYLLIARLTLQEIQSVGAVKEYTTGMVKYPSDSDTESVGEKVAKEEK